ncbi:hypothetical protein NHG29_04885 [Aerococcaceae bacterium NML160702]|nr:hypothetical protein [Aerococcaceae bacterium NML160702]
MKKQLLTLLATLSLTSVPLSVLAQESSSSVESSSPVTTEVTEQVKSYSEQFQTKTSELLSQFTNVVSNVEAQVNEQAETINQVFTDYAEKLKVKISELVGSEQLQQAIQKLTEAKRSLEDVFHSLTIEQKQELSNQLMAYLIEVKPLLVFEDGTINPEATDIQIEMTWKLIKVAEKYQLIVEDAKGNFESLKLEFACAEFHRLVTTCFNEDGSFKEKLYSKHMTEFYNLLKDKKSDFVKEYQARYDNILKEIEARKAADKAVKQIEEKRSKGEQVTDEELKAVEAAVAKVQTQSHREVAQSTKEAVITSQTNNTAYEKSTPKPVEQPKKETPKEKAPSPEPVPTPPVVVVPEPVDPTPAPEPEPIAPAFQPDGVTTFWTFDEADNAGYAAGMNNSNIASYFVMEVPNGDGTSHFALYFEYRQ